MTAISSLIQIRKLCKSYVEGDQRHHIFQDLDLDIHSGELVALVGRSGCGKSTLLNLVSGIDLPDSGQIQIDDQIINTLNETDRTRFRRRHIGFVFQFFNLIPTLTVAENVRLPLELNGLNDSKHHARAQALLNQVGLAERGDSFPERLSGGEQQRLALVRALAHDPQLLLADEPTGNLDADTGNQVLELLLGLTRQAKTTVLMVTHSREIAARADRILSLSTGSVHEEAQ